MGTEICDPYLTLNDGRAYVDIPKGITIRVVLLFGILNQSITSDRISISVQYFCIESHHPAIILVVRIPRLFYKIFKRELHIIFQPRFGYAQ